MQKGQNIHITLGLKILFSARGERYVYLKKIVPRVEISPGGEFRLAYV